MGKRNKIRYQSRGNQFPKITISGCIFLRHEDEAAIPEAEKGDLQIFLSIDSLPYNTRVGDYEAMGLEGYIKADVYDGKGWKPLSLEEFFSEREHYFGKRERPIDTVNVCLPLLQRFKGKELMRTYREHYVLCGETQEEE